MTRRNLRDRVVLSVLLGMVAGLPACGVSDVAPPPPAAVPAAATAAALPGHVTGGPLPARRRGDKTWNSVKFGGGGYVTGLVFHPTTANLLYARTDIGGAYRWNQATSSWTPITDGLGFGAAESRYHGVESIAVDPNNDQLVYMAAGMYTSEGNGRLYLSSDRGDHWTYVALPFPLGGNNPGRAIGERLMVDPNKPSTLFYGSRTAGLWKSTDSGLTWAQVTSLSSAKLTQDQVNALGMSSAMGVETVVYDTGTKGSGSATQTIYARHRAGLRPAPRAWPRTCTSPPTAAPRGPRSRSPSPAITSRTWCAPRTACSMWRSPRTPARAPPAPPGSTNSTATTGPCSRTRTAADRARPRARRPVRLRHRREHPHRAGRDQHLGQLQRPASRPVVRRRRQDLARDRGHDAAYAGRRRLLGLARRRRDRSVQPRPHAARPLAAASGKPATPPRPRRAGTRRSTASRRPPSWASPRRRPARRTP